MRPPVQFTPPPHWQDLLGYRAAVAPWAPTAGGHFSFIGSGKAGIALILSNLRERGIIANKMAPLLVPRWLGIAVYQTMTIHAFPTLAPTPETRALWVYHQYGFPQDMDRLRDYAHSNKLALIEDCAHACASRFKGIPLGGFGVAAVYSFSKFAFCYALGGVGWSDPALSEGIDRSLRHGSRVLRAAINASKLADEVHLASPRRRCAEGMTHLRTAAYSAYARSPLPSRRAIRLWESKGPIEIEARRRNYRFVLERATPLGLCDDLEPDGITPFAIPLRVPPQKAEAVAAALRQRGIDTAVYRFDYARFMIEPHFQPCVLLPCHSGVDREDLDRMLHIVKANL